MEFTINKQIFAHSLTNPPTEASGSNIELLLDSIDSLVKLEKENVSICTPYTLIVNKPLELGFTTPEQVVFYREFQNLVLAFNLILSRVCITSEDFIASRGGVNIIPPESKVSVERIGNEICVNFEENIVIREKIQTTIGISEMLVLQKIIEIFQKLQGLNRYNLDKYISVDLSNTSKALAEYESAMSNNNRIIKFKHLFNALELITNKDGKRRESADFDLHVANISSTQQKTVETWRKLYNRIKHPDRHSADIQIYLSGMESIASEHLIPLRSCCSGVILVAI